MDDLPLVSCVMPTYNRRKFIPNAIRYFQRQDYPNKELIVVDDGSDCIRDLIPENQSIKYIRLENKITLGEKLNIACINSSGSLIANWDDDDWYAPRRLKYQVNELKENNTKVCGINNLLYFDLINNRAYQYKYPSDQRKWLLGSSLCYFRSHWESNKFENINVGMDGLFVWRTSSSQVTVLSDSTMSVHMIHDHNISPKKTSGDWWKPYPMTEIEQIMHTDLEYYDRDKQILAPERSSVRVAGDPVTAIVPNKVKNVYACLVHERLDCVIDMVRNLHFQDPSSTIIIFNGGQDFQLNSSLFPFEDFGAIIHPCSFPVKHGYLLDSALECMQFAIDNFSFDILTIVDSDQLAMQPGYSEFMSGFFSQKSNIGLLSNRPERLTEKDTDVWTSIQPYKEYDLWKPLLKTFSNGKDKFVHWSFWPSTVFTYDAVKDLVKLFKTNTLLQNIMKSTKIWATEEIILPTMVSLLGYDIQLNPCCHDFVSYQKEYSTHDLDCAFNDPYAFWIHPVPRKYDDTLRKHTRKQLNSYVNKPKEEPLHTDCTFLLSPYKVLQQIESIEGWLSAAEAELLLSTSLNACFRFPQSQVVEVGCYHGKASVLLGNVAKSVSDKIKLYAIDTHDGILGSADQGLFAFPPSLEPFKKNIINANLSNTVVSMVNKSTNIEWSSSISFLLIDGLHDYINVSNDFRQFSYWIETGGYVAFHDFADYFPDVKAFVNELLIKKPYQIVHQADTLIVLQKVGDSLVYA